MIQGWNERFYRPVISYFTHEQTNAAKGVLILSVIISHNTLLAQASDDLYSATMYFHVAAFLVFPFLYDPRPLNSQSLRVWGPRYLVPFFVFLCLESALYYISTASQTSLGEWGSHFFYALIFHNAYTLDLATGLQTLWFLPAYFTTTLCVAFLFTKWKPSLTILLPLAFVLCGFVGLIPEAYKFWVPLGLLPAMVVLLPGILVRLMLSYLAPHGKKLIKKRIIFVLALTTFLLLEILCLMYFRRFSLSKLYLAGIDQPLDLISHIGLIVASLTTFLYMPNGGYRKLFAWFGRHSLFIFLVHQIIYHILLLGFSKLGVDVNTQPVLWGISLYIMTVTISVLCVLVLDLLPFIKRMIMPRDLDDWPVYTFVKRKMLFT